MKYEKYSIIVYSLAFFAAGLYMIYGGTYGTVHSKNDLFKLKTIITKIITQPADQDRLIPKKNPQSLHYTFNCRGYNNEFYIAPNFTDIFLESVLKTELIKNPNQIFEIGIKKSHQSKLNNKQRINVYSIESENDYILNINLVLKKNQGSRWSSVIGGILILIIMLGNLIKGYR